MSVNAHQGGRSATGSPIVLCVEDEADLREDIVDELRASGYAALGAADGLAAFGLLKTVRPDLVLCDISMPGLGGYELLNKIRTERPDLADVPFVFLTALNDRSEVIGGKRAGADDYLVKPVDFDLLIASIEARLNQVRRINGRADARMDALRGALRDGGLEGPAEGSRGGSSTLIGQVLDLLAFGVVLVGEQGRVVFANRAARALHEAGVGLVIDSTLRTHAPEAREALRTLLAQVTDSGPDGEDGIGSLPVRRAPDQRDLLLVACALDGTDAEGARAVVFVTDPERRPNVPDDVLSNLFGLTPSEAQVARLLAHGYRGEKIAEALGVSATTVAFHKRNLFQKTDTNRQADLISLILVGLVTLQPSD